MIPTTPEAEVGESQIRGLPGLQSDFKTSPSNLLRPLSLKRERARDVWLSGREFVSQA